MTIARTSRSWAAAMAAVAVAACTVLLVPSGCSTLPVTGCGEEPVTSVCAQLQYQCGTAVVCFSCGAAKRVDCGSCADTQTCGGGGTPHVCWPPIPEGGVEGGAGAADAAGTGTEAGDTGTDTAEASADAGSSDAEVVEAEALDAGSDGTVGAMSDGSADAAIDDGGALLEDGEAPAMVLCSEDALPPEDAGH